MQGESPTGKVSEAEVGKCKEAFNSNARGGGGQELIRELSSCCHPRLCKY